ncbi:MAG TPA: sialidase family protein [Pseudonocardiaceae bacterium]
MVLIAAALSLFSATTGWATTSSVGVLQQVSGDSPFAACTADDVAAQEADGSIVYHDSEVEPWVAASTVDLNADGAADVIAGYQQDRWNDGGARGVYASVWYQGGWTQVAIPGTSACVGSSHLRATDPWVTFSPNGAAYFFTLATSAGNDSALYVNKSVDGGLHWGPPVTLIEQDSLFQFNDKNSITADPFDSNYVYAIWDRSRFPSDKREAQSLAGNPHSLRSDAMFSRTTDGGQTWEPPRAIFQPQANEFGIGHQIVVLSDGTLVDSFMLFHGSGSNKKGQEVAVMISRDRGATWTEPITVAKVLPGYIRDPEDGRAVRTGDIIPDIAAGPNGSVYIVWQEATLAPSGSAIALSTSHDGGLTWSAPTRINTVPTTQAFTSSIEVLPDGTLGVTHYDFRFNTPDGGATLPTDYWFLHSHDDGATWAESRVTTRSFDMRTAPYARGLFVGDYEGLATQSGQFLALFSQTHGADPASVFFTRITP